MDKNIIKLINDTYLFKGLRESEIENIIRSLNTKLKDYYKNENIINVGDTSSFLGIVISGKAQIVGEDYFGRKIIFSELEAKDIFAEVYALLETEFQISISTLTNTKILWIDIHSILSIKNSKYEKLIKNLLISIARRNLKLTQKINHIAKKNIREKLLSYLHSEALKHKSESFSIPFNRQDLANYLFVDRSALSSEISKLKKEGILETNKNTFILKNFSHKNPLYFL